MKISELVGVLNKVQQVAGDVPIVLKAVEDGAETGLLSVGVHIDPTTAEGGSVALEHGQAPPASPAPEPEPAAPPAA